MPSVTPRALALVVGAITLASCFSFVPTGPILRRSARVSAPTSLSVTGVWADQLAEHKSDVVKTVSDCCQDFYAAYPKAVSPAFRTALNEVMQVTHLTVVDVRFNYDAVFACGLCKSYDALFNSYPGKGEKEAIFAAISGALGFSPEALRSDAEAIKSWAKGVGIDGLKDAANGSGEFNDVFKAMKADTIALRMYSRNVGIGIFALLDEVGAELNVDSIKEWAVALGAPPNRLEADYLLFSSTLQKIAALEQMMKEVEIREKKKMASRLEDKAASASKAAAIAAGDVVEEAEAPAAAAVDDDVTAKV